MYGLHGELGVVWFILSKLTENHLRRCAAEKGEDAKDCQKYARYYRSLCPGEWVRICITRPSNLPLSWPFKVSFYLSVPFDIE
jgi:hypothetical protein